jgi:prepilin-type N-terminal cleavage/methylation domain-containing protein
MQKGFTLVEIAIVLVIIGLLLGGILKGQEMIIQAKVKNSIADFSGVSAAYFGYQDRYRAIPGDDKDAGTRWATAPAASPGNGDKNLVGLYIDVATAETSLWWDHLRRAGFISGTGVTNPENSFSGKLGVQAGNGAGGAAFTDMTLILLCSTRLPEKVAISVDVQMDDGKPDRGFVRALAGTTDVAVGGAAVTPDYVESGTGAYTLCRQF